MKIKLELTATESLVVLNALKQYAVSPDNEKDKEIAEKVQLDIRKAASKAFRAEHK